MAAVLLKTRSRSNRPLHKFPAYLRKIRQCPCVICGAAAEAAHLRFSSAQYNKVNSRDDQWVTPLCPYHHRLGPKAQHSMGEFKFWEMFSIDPLAIALRLWQARDDLEAMQRIAKGE